LHQSFKEFLPFDDDMVATLSLSDLPQGFDLIINGHLHWFSDTREKGVRLLIPGSTIVTQMKKLEAEKRKGFVIYDSATGKAEFHEIENQRKLYYRKIDFENATAGDVRKKVSEEFEKIIAAHSGKKPLVRLKLSGTLALGVSPSDLDLRALSREMGEKAILSLDGSFSHEHLKKKLHDLRNAQREKKSVSAIGLDILENYLEETHFKKSFDVKRVFGLLSKGENEKVIELLSERG